MLAGYPHPCYNGLFLIQKRWRWILRVLLYISWLIHLVKTLNRHYYTYSINGLRVHECLQCLKLSALPSSGRLQKCVMLQILIVETIHLIKQISDVNQSDENIFFSSEAPDRVTKAMLASSMSCGLSAAHWEIKQYWKQSPLQSNDFCATADNHIYYGHICAAMSAPHLTECNLLQKLYPSYINLLT